MTNWKTIAIIFIILFTLETSFFIWAWNMYAREQENQNTCFYEICDGYIDAWYYEDVCLCYDENHEIVKKEWMG